MKENLIGQRFKQLIDKTGKSQKEIAKLLDTSAVFISNIVSGKRGLGPDIQRRLRALGFDVDWVLTGRKEVLTDEARGTLLAKYYLPNTTKVKKVIVDTDVTEDGISISIFSLAESVVYELPKETTSLVAENAAERKNRYHYWIGIPAVICTVIVGVSFISDYTKDNSSIWLKILFGTISLIAATLSSLQTFFNFQKQVEGHKRVGNQYLELMKFCSLTIGFFHDNLIADEDLKKSIAALYEDKAKVDREAEGYHTNQEDYEKARLGVENGEESYTEKEKEL